VIIKDPGIYQFEWKATDDKEYSLGTAAFIKIAACFPSTGH